MGRNVSYEFVSTDSDELVSAIIAVYEELTGISVRPSSPEKLFIQWVANILVLERTHINRAGNSNIPSRAEGSDLDALGETIFDLARPEPGPSVVRVRFYLSEAQNFNILIPAGTRVTDAGWTLYWSTDKDTYIYAGEGFADIPCTCETSGTVGNGYELGQINTIVDVFEYYSRCENVTVSDGGTDAATDDEYYGLMVQSLNKWSTAGARGGYIYYARQVSTEIADVIVKQPDAGLVYIYALMDDGTLATEEIKREILKACSADDVRPLTDCVSVHDGEPVPYNVRFTYYTARDTAKNVSQMEKDVQAAVDSYIAWQSARFGRDINPDKLRSYLLEAGVKRIVLDEPEFTILRSGDSEDYAAPQIAAVGEIEIRNGGYEDE